LLFPQQFHASKMGLFHDLLPGRFLSTSSSGMFSLEVFPVVLRFVWTSNYENFAAGVSTYFFSTPSKAETRFFAFYYDAFRSIRWPSLPYVRLVPDLRRLVRGPFSPDDCECVFPPLFLHSWEAFYTMLASSMTSTSHG